MLELERTYLAKYIPNLSTSKNEIIQDLYLPKSARHPTLRFRKKRFKYEITKKQMIDNDPKKHKENSISISEEEFSSIIKTDHLAIIKTRYYYQIDNILYQFDLFEGSLTGLVVIDIEFNDVKEMNSFTPHDFCLVDVSELEFIAGGILCHQSYEDIQPDLDKLGYHKLLY